MGRMPPEVLMGELSLFWQHIFTWGSWAIVLAMLIIAIRMGKRQGTPFYLLAIVAAGVGAYIEPLYDVAFDLWFYDVHDGQPGAMFSHFTAFGIVQPNWTHSGYIILYATACLYAGRALYEGRVTPKLLLLIWLAEITASCVFEVIGTGVNVYTYYGPYVLRIWNYPLVIGVLEGTQVIIFTMAAAYYWRNQRSHWGLLGLLLIFPVTMMGANAGLGAPIIVALHLEPSAASGPIIWAATLLTLVMCTLTVLGLSKMLPRGQASVTVRQPTSLEPAATA